MCDVLVFPCKKQRLMNKIKAVESAFAKASGSTVERHERLGKV